MYTDDTELGTNIKIRHEFGPFIWLPGITTFHLMLNVLISSKCHQQLNFTLYSISFLCLIWLVILHSFLLASNIFMPDFLVWNIIISNLCLIIFLSEVLSYLFLRPVVFTGFCCFFLVGLLLLYFELLMEIFEGWD